MKPLVAASNMYNEIDQVKGWWDFAVEIADSGILIVDSGSTDGTQQFFEGKKKEGHNVVVIHDEIIQREGYGPARNHLRHESRVHFKDSHWVIYLDADERIMPDDFHKLRWIKDYLSDEYDVVAFPRIDWINTDMKEMAKDWRVMPDWQGRMTRLGSPLRYIRRLHEQIVSHRNIYNSLSSPKIHHFHRSAGEEKRDMVGKLCAKLHAEDTEWGHTVPKHHKEDMYYERYLEEGL